MPQTRKPTPTKCKGCVHYYLKEHPQYFYSSTKLTITERMYYESWCSKYRGRIKNIRYCKGKVMPSDSVSDGREDEGREAEDN